MSTAAWLPRPPPPPSSAPRWSPPPPASPSPQTPQHILCKNISLLAKKYLPLSRGWRRGWGRMRTPRPPHRWVSRATLAIRITLRILFFEIDVDFSFSQLVDLSWAKALTQWLTDDRELTKSSADIDDPLQGGVAHPQRVQQTLVVVCTGIT